MSSIELQASSGLATIEWHSIDWAACYRRVRSLQRRIVQAVQAGAWRKVKRLSYLLVRSFSARALAVKRVTENAGKKTPGMDGELWDTPEKKAHGVARIGQWHRYRPVPLKRIYIPKRNGRRRPLSIPAMVDRARQALWLHALQPIAETTADRNSYGFRPKRRCADAIDQCFKVLRQKSSAEWILEGDIEGFFDHIRFDWLEEHIPMNRRVLSKWLNSGVIERGTLYPTTEGVPQGGIISPTISNQVLDGLEAVVCHSYTFRRRHNINFVRWADDFIVTANSREVLEETIRPRIDAFLAQRGVRLSPQKTVITPIDDGFDFLSQTLRKHACANGQAGKLRIIPSKAAVQALKVQIKTVCQQAAGTSAEALVDTLNPILRGWANYHRHSICSDTFASLDNYVWQRLWRWTQRRHSNKTGRWRAHRYFLHRGAYWQFTDPVTGKRVIRLQQAVTPQRHIKVKAEANPFDREWEGYFQHRDRQLMLKASSTFRARVLQRQNGSCPVCRQVIQCEQDLELHHWDHNHRNNHIGNLVLLHPNCHRQLHYAPENTTESPRPLRGVGHA